MACSQIEQQRLTCAEGLWHPALLHGGLLGSLQQLLISSASSRQPAVNRGLSVSTAAAIFALHTFPSEAPAHAARLLPDKPVGSAKGTPLMNPILQQPACALAVYVIV